MDEAASASSTAKNVGRVMTALIVIAAVIGVWFLIQPFVVAAQNPKPYQDALEKEMTGTVYPALMEELESEEFQTAMRGVGDTVVAKLQERDEEAYAAVDREIRAFVDEMTTWGEQEITTRRDGIREYVEKKVTDVAPELKDDAVAEQVLANASKGMDGAVNRIVEKYLQGHMNHLISIGDQIQKFPVPDDVAAMTDDELSDTLVQELGAYSMSIFQTSLSPETRAFLRQVGEEETQ
jgi:hypothetical protein